MLARYAAAVFAAVEAALEAEATDAKLLPPLLAVLAQVRLTTTSCSADRSIKAPESETSRAPSLPQCQVAGCPARRQLLGCPHDPQQHVSVQRSQLVDSPCCRCPGTRWLWRRGCPTWRTCCWAGFPSQQRKAKICHVFLTQVSRHEVALVARLPNLVDLLLGWALDPQLPPHLR